LHEIVRFKIFRHFSQVQRDFAVRRHLGTAPAYGGPTLGRVLMFNRNAPGAVGGGPSLGSRILIVARATSTSWISAAAAPQGYGFLFLCGVVLRADYCCGVRVMLTDPAQTGTQPSSPTTPPAKPRRTLRYLLFTVLGLLAVIVIAVVILIVMPPASLLTPIIVKTVTSQSGRELKIGAASYAFRPDFIVHFDNVTLSNPGGMTGSDLLQAAGLDARISLASLLKGSVTVSELTVTQPVLTLHRDASGKANWALPPQNSNIVSQVSLVKGSVSYRDEQAGQSLQITDVTGSLSQKAAAQEAKISGTTVWRAEPINVDIDVADVQALVAGSATSVTLAATSKHVNANATGNVAMSDKGRFQGTFTVSTPSPADLARWLGSTTPSGVRLSATSLAGQIDATPTGVELQKAQLTLDGANSVWNVRLDLATKPTLTGTIDVPVLDLTVLSAGGGPARAAALTPATPPITVVPAYQSLASDLDKLDQELGSAPPSVAPQSTASVPTTSLWSTEVIDLAALSTIDMDVKATAGRVHLDRLNATSGVLAVSVKDGKLEMAVQQLELDKGQISGRLQLQNGKASQAQTAITVGADNVPVDSILKEFMASPALTGATKLDLSASGQGRTQRDLVSSLTGKASFSISGGAIAGFDLRSMVLEWWRSWSFDPSRKTEFSVLRGSYDIHQGDLRNASDLAFRGKDVDISSSGNINLATGVVDQSVRLQLTPPPTHLPIPLKVSGTLTAPAVGLDWSSIFSSPGTVGGPSQVALAPEPLPADIKQKVQNILTTNTDNPKLAPQTRDALKALLASPASNPDNSKN
jgi:AsmA protein